MQVRLARKSFVAGQEIVRKSPHGLKDDVILTKHMTNVDAHIVKASVGPTNLLYLTTLLNTPNQI